MINKAVYTAIAGDYNELRDHPDVPGVDWVAFVPQPERIECSNWELRPLFSYGEPDPRRQAKWYKVQSLLEMAEYDRTLWIDGSCEVLRPNTVRMLLDFEDPIALYVHPDRDCVYEEAGFSLGMRKYQQEPIRDQVQYYIDEFDHPQHWGLWFTGLLLRNRCPETERIERLWWNEIDRWSYQDQVSLPVVFRNLGIEPRSSLYFVNGKQSFVFHQQPTSK